MADGLLQLALLVVVGALVTLLVALQTEARARFESQREKERTRFAVEREQRLEVLRRLRAANQRIQVARRLINTHDSARTYSEQLRDLIATRADLEDLREDLRVGSSLF